MKRGKRHTAASLALVLAVAACDGRLGPTETRDSSIQPATPSAMATASGMVSPAAPTPTTLPDPTLPDPTLPIVTPLPSVLLKGETPGPDATIPPGVGVIPRLRIETVAAMWEALGMECESWMTSFPDSDGLFGDLHCERRDPGENADYVAEADFWTPTGIQYISMTVLRADRTGSFGDAELAWLLVPSVRAFIGDPAADWVAEHLVDPGCEKSLCTKRFDGSVLGLDVSPFGAAGLHVEAAP